MNLSFNYFLSMFLCARLKNNILLMRYQSWTFNDGLGQQIGKTRDHYFQIWDFYKKLTVKRSCIIYFYIIFFLSNFENNDILFYLRFKEDILFWKRDPFGSFIYYYTKCNILFNNNKNTSHHSLSVLDDKLKQKMKSPKHLSTPSDPKTNSKTKNPN